MKYLKRFNESSGIDKERIIRDLHTIAPNMKVRDELAAGRIKIDFDGTVDVDGTFIVDSIYDTTRLPVKFGTVTGAFLIETSKFHSRLTTLEGCPHECGGIRAVNQDITNLVGAPKVVRGFGRSLDTSFNVESCKKLTSLEGSPEFVGHIFNIKDTGVTSLEGGPTTVGGGYNCSKTQISNLIGLPETLKFFHADYCPNLTSLEGLPKKVDSISLLSQPSHSENIWDPRPLRDCEFERLLVSQGSPIYELMDCFNPESGWRNSLQFLKGDKFCQVCKNFKESLDYNYIRGTKENPQINLFRFKEALSEFDITELRSYQSEMQISDRLIHYQFVDDSGRPVNFEGQLI